MIFLADGKHVWWWGRVMSSSSSAGASLAGPTESGGGGGGGRGGAAGQTLRLYGERKRSDRLLVSFLFFLPAVWVSTTGHVVY